MATSSTPKTFADLGLDHRLQRALAKRGFSKPTAVQAEAIPRTLEGKDVVARARTGSGKTLAYLLPALHRVLATEEDVKGSFKAIILVPTRELCEQVGGAKCVQILSRHLRCFTSWVLRQHCQKLTAFKE